MNVVHLFKTGISDVVKYFRFLVNSLYITIILSFPKHLTSWRRCGWNLETLALEVVDRHGVKSEINFLKSFIKAHTSRRNGL